MPNAIATWVKLHEAADLTFYDIIERIRDKITELLGGESDDRWIWVRDVSETWAVYEDSGAGSPNPGCYRVTYTLADDGTITIDGPAVAVEVVTTYEPAPDEPAPTSLAIEPTEAELVGDTINLVETVIRRDGTVPIKIIQPGWGSSGYYAEDMIKESGPSAFPAGTHMYWDHPTATEESDRPERSLRDLSATLVTDAYWMDEGSAGPGLYGDARVIADYQPVLEELAPHIGVSIRAEGTAHPGLAEGRTGQIVDEITVGKSIDFVTAAGAGGAVLSLFEAARGARRQPTPPKEDPMELSELREANTKLSTELTEAKALGYIAAVERDQLREQVSTFTEAAILTEARDSVTFALAEAKYARLPDITKRRLTETVAGNPPVDAAGKLDAAALTTRFTEAVGKAVEEIAAITGRGTGTITGLGGDLLESDTPSSDETIASIEESFSVLGLSEAGSKAAVAGRR